MKKCIADLSEKCEEEIEDAAYESYHMAITLITLRDVHVDLI